MFVRKKKNKSGSVSVQIIDKSKGYRVVKTMGSATDQREIERLVELGRIFIEKQSGQYSLFPDDERDNAVIREFVRSLRNASVRTAGPELIFGRLFDEIGFSEIPEPLFRDVVITRLVYPVSKLKTVDYLYRYQGKVVSADSIYLFLDRLNQRYSQQAKEIAFGYSKNVLKQINVVFYDMTTLYFEAEDEDDLRKIGFSKDGKFQHPQIMLGLLVGENGYPIGYDIFEGNTFEGYIVIPVLKRIEQEYHFGKPIVVADAAMLNKKNLDALRNEGFPFIIAARILNESSAIRDEILRRGQNLVNGETFEIGKENGERLIISYSDKRAKKDRYNREKGLQRLHKRMNASQLTKDHLNNRGYNKFLKLSGKASIEIDYDKIEQASLWDGLKGYLTNTDLSAAQIIGNYGQLWHIEKAFRISKTDLRVRPIFHRLRRRIEAHILVSFVAYTIYKEVERRLQEAGLNISPKRAAELTQTMYEIHFALPTDPQPQQELLQMDEEQRQLYELIF